LHFQHQSFAEILLAEYYLKVFIKYAIDKQPNVEMARSKLILGEPTAQTVEFFKELLHLLKDTVSDEPTNEVLEKRKLLYSLMATLASDRHNRLYCERIDSKWFENAEIDNSSSTIHPDLLENWAIKPKELEQIIELAREIIDSKTTLLLAKTESRTALFDKELTVFQNAQVSDSPTDMDKWLALVVGNLLHDDKPEERDFFNGRLESPENLFEMIRGWNYSMDNSAPEWSKDYFIGILMKKISMDKRDFVRIEDNSQLKILHSSNLNHLNFSYSNLSNLSLHFSNLRFTNFTNCTFQYVSCKSCDIKRSIFKDVKIYNAHELDLSMAYFEQYIFLPHQLVTKIRNMDKEDVTGLINLGGDKTTFGKYINIEDNFITFEGLFILGLKNNLFDIPEIKSWFDYGSEKDREVFEGLIDGLEV